jgi:hypothetical protein
MLASVAGQMVHAYAIVLHRAHCYPRVLFRWYPVGKVLPQPDGSVEQSLAFPLVGESVRFSARIMKLVVVVLDPADGEGSLLTRTVGRRGLIRNRLTWVVRPARVKGLRSL